VTKVHVEVAKMRAAGREIVMIGQPRASAWRGPWAGAEAWFSWKRSPTWRAWTCRDRRSILRAPDHAFGGRSAAIVGALKARFPSITGPKKDDICYRRTAEPAGRREIPRAAMAMS